VSIHGIVCFSADGRRLVVSIGHTELVEIDVASDAVVRRFTSPAQLSAVTFLGSQLLVAREEWAGDLWTARLPR
jgi:hypothetical protein